MRIKLSYICQTFPALVAVCLLVLTSTGKAAAQNEPQMKRGQSTIRGVVTYNDTGRPVRNATVVMFSNSGGFRWDVVTGRRGEFVFEEVLAGRYILLVAAPGILTPQNFRADRSPLIAQLRLNEERDFFTEVTVNGTDSVDVKVKAARGGVITGRVVTEDDQPLAGADIKLLRRENGKWLPVRSTWETIPEPQRTLKTDADGVYRIAGLTSGDYVVRVSESTIAVDAMSTDDDGYSNGSFMVTYYPAANSIKEAQAVSVVEGSESTAIDIRVPERAAHTISGRVLGPQNSPRSTFRVRMERSDEIGYASDTYETGVTPNDEGDWQIRGIPSGEYVLTINGTAELPGFDRRRRPASVARKQIKVSVVDDDVVVPDITMSLGASVQGQVTLDGKASNHNFQLYPRLTPIDSPRSDTVLGSPGVSPKGKFLIEGVAPGKYWLEISTVFGEPFYVKAITRKGVDLLQTPIKLANEQMFDDVVVTLATDFASVEGEVARPAGQPKRSLDDVVVVLAAANDATRNAGGGLLTSQPDAQGKFNFSCAPGEYFLVVLTQDQLRKLPKPIDENYFKNANQKFTRVKVRSAEKVKGLAVTLDDK